MTEKTVIKPEQVVTRKGGNISYINDNSVLVQAKESTVIVQGEDPAEQAKEPTPAEAPAAEPTPEVPPHVVAATDNPSPADNPAKPAKKKGKAPKETTTVATSAAAKKAPAKAKTPAKKTVSKAPKEGGVRTIGGKPVDISKYEKAKAPGGGTSYHNGDSVAELLAGKDLDQCYKIAAQKLKIDEKDLRKQYTHLNVGMQRMNLGNRLRKVLIPKEAK